MFSLPGVRERDGLGEGGWGEGSGSGGSHVGWVGGEEGYVEGDGLDGWASELGWVGVGVVGGRGGEGEGEGEGGGETRRQFLERLSREKTQKDQQQENRTSSFAQMVGKSNGS